MDVMSVLKKAPVESPDGRLADAKSLLLEKAENYQTIHFGQDHSSLADENMVISLLPELKALGFDYFAYELDSFLQPRVDSYLEGKISFEQFDKIFPYYPEETLPTLIAAHELRYKIVLFDEEPESEHPIRGDAVHSKLGTDRAEKQFHNLKTKIFDKEPEAKVIIFSGRAHIDEKPRHYLPTQSVEKALGFFLEEYTHGKNLSVSLVYETDYMLRCLACYVRPEMELMR